MFRESELLLFVPVAFVAGPSIVVALAGICYLGERLVSLIV